MATTQSELKPQHIILWIAQVLLALLLLSGTILKFMPISQVSAMMPWTAQVPAWSVRALGIIDLLGALGLILPALLRIEPIVTPWAATAVAALMLCAMVFHVSRGEGSDIGINIIAALLAVYIAWGRFKKYPVTTTPVEKQGVAP